MPIEAPLELHRETVRPEWIDYNGHMNVAYYVLVFDHATDAFYDLIGVGADYAQRCHRSVFSVEAHVTYQREVGAGAPLSFTVQLLEYDEKRIRFFVRMWHVEEGFLAATIEWLALHVDLERRRVVPLPEDALTRLAEIMDAHRDLPAPAEAGRGIRLKQSAAP